PFMAPLIIIGATIPVRRKPAMNVSVSQCHIGTSPIRRSPRGLQPLGRTMLVVTAVSSINTRRAGSSSPCSRIQRRRARATSARFRSAARRLFFNSNAVTSKKSGERTAASRNSPLVQCQDDLIQCEVWSLAVERKDLLGVLLQWRSASAARHRFASPVLAKALHPPDGGTDADVELFSRFTAGAPLFNKADKSPAQITRIRAPERAILLRIKAFDLIKSLVFVHRIPP